MKIYCDRPIATSGTAIEGIAYQDLKKKPIN